jgi:hypothetical protein
VKLQAPCSEDHLHYCLAWRYRIHREIANEYNPEGSYNYREVSGESVVAPLGEATPGEPPPALHGRKISMAATDATGRWVVLNGSEDGEFRRWEVVDLKAMKKVRELALPKHVCLDENGDQQHLFIVPDAPWLVLRAGVRRSHGWPRPFRDTMTWVQRTWADFLDPQGHQVYVANWQTGQWAHVRSLWGEVTMYTRATGAHLALWMHMQDPARRSLEVWAMPPAPPSRWVTGGAGLVTALLVLLVRRRRAGLPIA